MSEFEQTRNLFESCTTYTEPLSYDDWVAIPSDYKAAVLYLHFYDQIQLAWFKSRTVYANEQLAVETLLQYLLKNVSVIESDASRFTPQYIYKVAYNCMFSVCHNRKVDKLRYAMEQSNELVEGNNNTDVVDMWDILPDITQCIDQLIEDAEYTQKFWDIVYSADADADVVVSSLLEHIPVPKGFGNKHKTAVIESIRNQLCMSGIV